MSEDREDLGQEKTTQGKISVPEQEVNIGPELLVEYWGKGKSLVQISPLQQLSQYFARANRILFTLPFGNLVAIFTFALSTFLLVCF